MNVLFIVFAVIGLVLLVALMVLMFGFGMKITLRIKIKKGKTIPIEEFVPRSIYGWSAFMADFGLLGIIFHSLRLPELLALAFDIPLCLLLNFIGSHFIISAAKNFYFGKLPDADDLTGIEAICEENIRGDGYGKIKFRYNGRLFIRDCIPVNHTTLAKGEKVIIITGEDDLLFVEKPSEIYDALKEDDENAV